MTALTLALASRAVHHAERLVLRAVVLVAKALVRHHLALLLLTAPLVCMQRITESFLPSSDNRLLILYTSKLRKM